MSAPLAFATDFVAPEFTENLNSSQPKETANLSRVEEWAYFSYIVNTKGEPESIEVIDKSSYDKYLGSAIDYVENLRYSPATFKGKAVPSALTFFFRYDKSFHGNNNDGISRGFTRYYNEADNLIANGKADKATESLEILKEDHSKNITEQALSAWLYSNYFFQKQAWPEYGAAVQTAHYINQSLPSEMRVKNAQNRMNWHVFKKELSDAQYALLDLKEVSKGGLSDAHYQEMRQQIAELITSTEINEIDVTLSNDIAWQHRVPRSNISLDLQNGEITFAELRCENGHQVFASFPISDVDIPQDYQKCSFFVKGTPDTQFSFKEQGALRVF